MTKLHYKFRYLSLCDTTRKIMKYKLMCFISVLLLLATVIIPCGTLRGSNMLISRKHQISCDFNKFKVTKEEAYYFNTPFSDQFSQNPRWLSERADIKLVNGKGQLTAPAASAQALEAWKLYKLQMPYNKSWEISTKVNIPLYWNSHGGRNAQVGVGIFVGKPVKYGQSYKVYECEMAVINGKMRFVQAQLIANRLDGDPIDVQYSRLNKSIEKATLTIKFCNSDKRLALFINNKIVGVGRRIDAKGLDNWYLSGSDLMDVGIVGFAENTTIKANQPTFDNFKYKTFE